MKMLFLTLFSLYGVMIGENTSTQSTVKTSSFIASISPVPNTSKVRILVSKTYGKKFSLSFLDENKNVLYFGEMTKQMTQHHFDLNLSELNNGKYFINLSDGRLPVVTKTIIKEQAILAKPILTNQIFCVD